MAAADRRSADVDRNVVPIVERRQAERRQGIEALRAEALKSVISRVEDRNFNGLKSRLNLRSNARLSRLLLLVVAIGAGATAAVLAFQRSPAPAPVVEAATPQILREARTPVLVARETIGIGQRLTPDLIGWEEWPEGAVRNEYLTEASAPDALAELTGAVARFEIFAGEPIRREKLAIAGQGGYLSAVLDSGMRGVSLVVSAASSSGGFIAPNDHVDVVLTRSTDGGSQLSETVLTNVRVLAINSQLGETAGPDQDDKPLAFKGDAIATLELDSRQAEVVNTAVPMGALSLVLRSMIEPPLSDPDASQATNQLIRMTSPFWNP